MSDFIYSKKRCRENVLSQKIQKLYERNPPVTFEFHGDWGSLAVSSNPYNGFLPFETSNYLMVVLGGPVLTFRDNDFLTFPDGTIGTEAIFNKWLKNELQWDEDLSGPFAVLIVDKKKNQIHSITDLLSFIPIYSFISTDNLCLSSHIDILAEVSNQTEVDVVSLVDFMIHGVVTFPFTSFKSLRQANPSTISTYALDNLSITSNYYWLPEEKDMFNSLSTASVGLRTSIEEFIKRVTNSMETVGQFLSGGEDSRVIAGSIPERLNRKAFVFLDKMNREGKIAQKVALKYNCELQIGKRAPSYYLDILPGGTKLVGRDTEYKHVHSFGFSKMLNCGNLPAVFGGLYSDAMLKGSRIKKNKWSRIFIVPQIKVKYHSLYNGKLHRDIDWVHKNILDEIRERKLAHLDQVKTFRNESAEEWIELWPSSMNNNAANISGNRRLFRSYEPFLANDVIKISAKVPQKWKLNRILFNKMAKSSLKKSKWILHGDGYLPYFPWFFNGPIKLIIKSQRKLIEQFQTSLRNNGPWVDWKIIQESKEWEDAIKEFSSGIKPLQSALVCEDFFKIYKDKLDDQKRVNFLQILYVNRNDKNM